MAKAKTVVGVRGLRGKPKAAAAWLKEYRKRADRDKQAVVKAGEPPVPVVKGNKVRKYSRTPLPAPPKRRRPRK